MAAQNSYLTQMQTPHAASVLQYPAASPMTARVSSTVPSLQSFIGGNWLFLVWVPYFVATGLQDTHLKEGLIAATCIAGAVLLIGLLLRLSGVRQVYPYIMEIAMLVVMAVQLGVSYHSPQYEATIKRTYNFITTTALAGICLISMAVQYPVGRQHAMELVHRLYATHQDVSAAGFFTTGILAAVLIIADLLYLLPICYGQDNNHWHGLNIIFRIVWPTVTVFAAVVFMRVYPGLIVGDNLTVVESFAPVGVFHMGDPKLARPPKIIDNAIYQHSALSAATSTRSNSRGGALSSASPSAAVSPLMVYNSAGQLVPVQSAQGALALVPNQGGNQFAPGSAGGAAGYYPSAPQWQAIQSQYPNNPSHGGYGLNAELATAQQQGLLAPPLPMAVDYDNPMQGARQGMYPQPLQALQPVQSAQYIDGPPAYEYLAPAPRPAALPPSVASSMAMLNAPRPLGALAPQPSTSTLPIGQLPLQPAPLQAARSLQSLQPQPSLSFQHQQQGQPQQFGLQAELGGVNGGGSRSRDPSAQGLPPGMPAATSRPGTANAGAYNAGRYNIGNAGGGGGGGDGGGGMRSSPFASAAGVAQSAFSQQSTPDYPPRYNYMPPRG